MSHLSTTIVVGAPAERVFDLLADPTRAVDWQTLIAEMGPASSRAGGVGSSFTGYYRVAGRRLEAHFVVIAAERPTLFEVTGTTPGGWVRWTSLIEATAGGCVVRAALEYELPGELVTSVFGMITGGRLQREVERTYRNLKTIAEQEAGAAAASADAIETADVELETALG